MRGTRFWPLSLMLGTMLTVLVAVAPAQLRQAAGFVLEVSGPSTPALIPYTEIADQTTIRLGPRSRLVFVHYRTCRTVTLVGGQLTAGVEGYRVSGGTQSKKDTPCPRAIKLVAAGETAGVLLRSGAEVRLPVEPAFVVVGPRAGDVASVRITRGDETLVEAALENRRFRWPSGSRALRPGTQYDLVFTFKEQGTKPRTLAFLTDPGGTVVEPRLTLITVE
ncbi:MAG TPA: hypothetical protein VFR64_20345 [Methylomirabilota bacterium]|nr:hypothetical protein [Methylomirabilota bacterium]